jgi:hypothetical protein
VGQEVRIMIKTRRAGGYDKSKKKLKVSTRVKYGKRLQ